MEDDEELEEEELDAEVLAEDVKELVDFDVPPRMNKYPAKPAIMIITITTATIAIRPIAADRRLYMKFRGKY